MAHYEKLTSEDVEQTRNVEENLKKQRLKVSMEEKSIFLQKYEFDVSWIEFRALSNKNRLILQQNIQIMINAKKVSRQYVPL